MDRANRLRLSRDGTLAGDVETLGRLLASARRVVALTGAGLSVESGIPDFRSPGGLWSVFDPMEYATLSCFLRSPAKAWELYRALGASIAGREPNAGHRALARLEREGLLAGIVTQNIDGLHRAAGSETVIEIHGEGRNLECTVCRAIEPLLAAHLEPGPPPRCAACGSPLKPNVVLFEEPVREMARARALVAGASAMLVVGTSAEVAPAGSLPGDVLEGGGSLVEFNLAPTRRTEAGLGPSGFFVEGPAGRTLPAVVDAALKARAREMA